MNNVGLLLKHIGRRIAELRRARGFTQEQLAERLDVSVTYVQQVERGGRNLTVRSLAAFASATGAKVAELFEAPTEPAPRPGRPRKRRP